MLIADFAFEKLFDKGALETSATLDLFMMFLDNFAPADSDQSQLFSSVLVDVIKEYQRQAFRLGFKCSVDAFLESRSISELISS